jgi:hypothetical protein
VPAINPHLIASFGGFFGFNLETSLNKVIGMTVDDTKQGMPVVISKPKSNALPPKPLKSTGMKPINPDRKSGTQYRASKAKIHFRTLNAVDSGRLFLEKYKTIDATAIMLAMNLKTRPKDAETSVIKIQNIAEPLPI